MRKVLLFGLCVVASTLMLNVFTASSFAAVISGDITASKLILDVAFASVLIGGVAYLVEAVFWPKLARQIDADADE